LFAHKAWEKKYSDFAVWIFSGRQFFCPRNDWTKKVLAFFLVCKQAAPWRVRHLLAKTCKKKCQGGHFLGAFQGSGFRLHSRKARTATPPFQSLPLLYLQGRKTTNDSLDSQKIIL